jgi:hypothetical protein
MAVFTFTKVGDGATFQKDSGPSQSIKPGALDYMNVNADGDRITIKIPTFQGDIISTDTINMDTGSGAEEVTGTMTAKRDAVLAGVFFLVDEEGGGETDHTHANKALLDTYTQTNANIASAVTNSHTHANKALLDTYAQTEVNLAAAVAATHTHANTVALAAVSGTNTGDQNLSGLAAVDSHSVLTYAGTTDIDFNSAANIRTLSLTGDVTFTTSNKAAAKSRIIRIIADGTIRNFTFPAWKWPGGAAPTSIAADKTAILSLLAFGTADTDIVAAYTVES